MAEVFGIVTGIVGLTAAGLQIAETVSKLKACRTVKADVSALIAELEAVQHIIDASQRSATACTTGQTTNNALFNACKGICQTAKDHVDATLAEIQRGLRKSTRSGATSFMLKKTSILECFARLERAKSLLAGALQVCHGYDRVVVFSMWHAHHKQRHYTSAAFAAQHHHV